MATEQRPWFSFSAPGETKLVCSACQQPVELEPQVDHHPCVCPRCGTESAYLNWKGRLVQVVPQDAPPAIATLLRWAQQNLGELEYVELFVAFEEIADALAAASADALATAQPAAGTTPR